MLRFPVADRLVAALPLLPVPLAGTLAPPIALETSSRRRRRPPLAASASASAVVACKCWPLQGWARTRLVQPAVRTPVSSWETVGDVCAVQCQGEREGAGAASTGHRSSGKPPSGGPLPRNAAIVCTSSVKAASAPMSAQGRRGQAGGRGWRRAGASAERRVPRTRHTCIHASATDLQTRAPAPGAGLPRSWPPSSQCRRAVWPRS